MGVNCFISSRIAVDLRVIVAVCEAIIVYRHFFSGWWFEPL